MATLKLTQKWVDRQKPGAPEQFRDKDVKGFMVQRNTRSLSYKVQRDLRANGSVRTVRVTLGRVEEMSLAEAKKRAQAVIVRVKDGEHPGGEVDQTGAPAAWTLTEAWAQYAAKRRRAERSESSTADFERHLRRHFDDWRDRPLNELNAVACRDRHIKITEASGPVAANHAMRALRAAYNYALNLDPSDTLRANPVSKGVEFHRERARESYIAFADLPEWWAKTAALPNVLRRDMHRFHLLSGLRPGNLVAVRKDWIDREQRAVAFPAEVMKNREPFDLPLSEPMIELIDSATKIGDVLYSGSPWLFPTRGKSGEVIATQVWKEKTLPGETGHIVRRTYRTAAHAAGVPVADGELLLAHKLGGVKDAYIKRGALFDHFLGMQERISEFILETANARTST